MANRHRIDGLIAPGLIVLGLIPVVAGMVRLAGLAGGGPITPDNARFFAAPIPVVVHVLAVTTYSLLGAFQFSPALRCERPRWHRAAGYVVVVAGLATAVSGLWMASTYAIVPADSALLHGLRLFFGSAMLLAIVLGLVAILRKDVTRHQDWMRRAYAIGLGAGTQAFIQIPPLLLVGEPDDLSRALMMGAGWVVNLAVAEALRRRECRLSRHDGRRAGL